MPEIHISADSPDSWVLAEDEYISSWYPQMPPMLEGETADEYTNRLTGADKTGRIPYDHKRFRQCSIGYHDECSDYDGANCRCPHHTDPEYVVDEDDDDDGEDDVTNAYYEGYEKGMENMRRACASDLHAVLLGIEDIDLEALSSLVRRWIG